MVPGTRRLQLSGAKMVLIYQELEFKKILLFCRIELAVVNLTKINTCQKILQNGKIFSPKAELVNCLKYDSNWFLVFRDRSK